MNTRERFKAIISGQPVDRLPLLEWAGWWDKTIQRWHQEELPATLTDRYDICRHFGLDIYLQDWLPVHLPSCPHEKRHGEGIISNEKDYEAILPQLYGDPFDNLDRVKCWQAYAKQQESGDAVLWFTMDGFFWFARGLLGIENHLLAFYDQPELLHRINSDLAEWMKKCILRLSEICVPDFMTFAEDMSYNNGPMLSQHHYMTFMHPYYEQVIPLLNTQSICPFIDSDGDITTALDWFAASGIQGVLPLERQAGVEIATLQDMQPEMIFIGHFDKMCMNKGENAIRAEFDRLLPLAARGRFIPSVDHQTPPGVSYQDYLVYMRCFKEFSQVAASSQRNLNGKLCQSPIMF